MLSLIRCSRAIDWVDEALLAEAHIRLPPTDLYYPIDAEAVREGRWQEQVSDTLEECGYEYFIPGAFVLTNLSLPTEIQVAGTTAGPWSTNDAEYSSQKHRSPNRTNTNIARTMGKVIGQTTTSHGNPAPPTAARVPLKHNPIQSFSSRSSTAGHPRTGGKDASSSSTRTIIERHEEEQIRGLGKEIEQAARAARTTFSVGDRIESRWSRPTRFDRPRLDSAGVWHPGRVVAAHKDGRVDVVFEHGASERLRGISSSQVRLAPETVELVSVEQPLVGNRGETENGRQQVESTTAVDLCPASRRELAHVARRTNAIRRTWQDPITMSTELTRLKQLWREKAQGRPEFNLSFPAVDFETAKSSTLGGSVRAAEGRMAQMRQQQKRLNNQTKYADKSCCSGTQLSQRSLVGRSSVPVQELRQLAGSKPNHRHSHRIERYDDRGQRQCIGVVGVIPTGGIASSSTAPASRVLAAVQFDLVSKAMSYDRYVASVRDCLDRGAAVFRSARTYTEQQTSFEEATATLGPAQPARAGYSDWRGRPICGLQSVTLDVVEAIDALAKEWAAARGSPAGDEP